MIYPLHPAKKAKFRPSLQQDGVFNPLWPVPFNISSGTISGGDLCPKKSPAPIPENQSTAPSLQSKAFLRARLLLPHFRGDDLMSH